jgi:ribosomal protein L10
MSLASLKTTREKIKQKINDILDTGQEYQIVGSHTVKNPQLTELRRELSSVNQEILRYAGRKTRTKPDFS